MQDSFSLLYLRLAEIIIEEYGEIKGGRIIREAVRRTGRDSGLAMREKHLRAGVLTNLRNLGTCGSNLIPDPRFRGKRIADQEERQIWEVYTCPLAHFWNWHGGSGAGTLFCEEFERARVLAYTEGKGQLNLSNRLTSERDGFCLFAAFYREANVSPEKAAASFSWCAPEQKDSSPDPENVSFRESTGHLTASFFYYLYETCEEMADDGFRAVLKEGLAAFLKDEVSALAMKAENTGKAADAIFLEKNFPLDKDPENDISWTGLTDSGAASMMKSAVLAPLAERFGGSCNEE